ncbi:MAG: hypothetical protein LBU65_16965 [Planctomycetaceae bacterium]|jgi:hypothetical protein|nr:hypothetical protein [Planctomycetaceae bacterium]
MSKRTTTIAVLFFGFLVAVASAQNYDLTVNTPGQMLSAFTGDKSVLVQKG